MHDIALQHQAEVVTGERFEFGKNWGAFLDVVDDERVAPREHESDDQQYQSSGQVWTGSLECISSR